MNADIILAAYVFGGLGWMTTAVAVELWRSRQRRKNRNNFTRPRIDQNRPWWRY